MRARKILISLVSFVVALILSLGFSLSMENSDVPSISIQEAHAQSSCTANGYKNWDDPDSEVNGKDCWCEDRNDVSNECEEFEPE